MNRVGVLPITSDEAIDRQSVKGSKGQRMAVNDEKGRLFGVRHGHSLASRPDAEPRPSLSNDQEDR